MRVEQMWVDIKAEINKLAGIAKPDLYAFEQRVKKVFERHTGSEVPLSLPVVSPAAAVIPFETTPVQVPVNTGVTYEVPVAPSFASTVAAPLPSGVPPFVAPTPPVVNPVVSPANIPPLPPGADSNYVPAVPPVAPV